MTNRDRPLGPTRRAGKLAATGLSKSEVARRTAIGRTLVRRMLAESVP